MSQHIILAESQTSLCQFFAFLKYTGRQCCECSLEAAAQRKSGSSPGTLKFSGTVVTSRGKADQPLLKLQCCPIPNSVAGLHFTRWLQEQAPVCKQLCSFRKPLIQVTVLGACSLFSPLKILFLCHTSYCKGSAFKIVGHVNKILRHT